MDLIASSFLLMLLWDVFKSRCFHAAGPLMSHGENGGNEEKLGKRELLSSI